MKYVTLAIVIISLCGCTDGFKAALKKSNSDSAAISGLGSHANTALGSSGRDARLLNICSDPSGVSCPETQTMFPSTEALTLPGTAYSDQIPDTLDLATWAQQYYHGAISSLVPAASVTGIWVPPGSYAYPFRAIYSESFTETIDGLPPRSFCGGAPPPCFEAEGVPQWAIALQTIVRTREMIGNNVDPNDEALELNSLRGVFAYDQNGSANLYGNNIQNLTYPFSYSVMLLNDLHRLYPGNATIRAAGNEYIRYLGAIAQTDGVFSFWNNLTSTQINSGIEGNGGYYNEHFLQVGAQAYMGMAIPEWNLLTGNATAKNLSIKTSDYLRNYGGGVFWTNPDPARFSDNNPPFVGHTLSYIPAYNAMLADATLRLKVNAGDQIAQEEVTRALNGYNFMKARGTAGVLGHFGVSSVLGQMMEMGIRLSSLRTHYPNQIPFSSFYEDVERWTRNQAAELRFDSSLAQYIGDQQSGNNLFNNVISRSLGTFVSDDAHPMMLPTFDFVDDNDGLWLMRGLYDVWKSAVEVNKTNGTTVAWVNLDLNSATQYMDVYSEIPYRGLVQVNLKNKIGDISVLAVRVPSWAGQNITINEDIGQGSATIAQGSRWSWNDRYVVIQGIRPGGKYFVHFPMVVQHLQITQLHSQNDWWNEADFGSTANPERPVFYTGTFLGDTLVSSDYHPVGGLPRYQRPQFAALILGNSVNEIPAPRISVNRFVASANARSDQNAEDLIQITPDGTLLAQSNQGGLRFSEPQSFGKTGNKVMLADLDGDGLSDLIQMGPDGSVIVQMNQGGLKFAPPQGIGQTGNQVLLADLDGDGLSDLIQMGPDGIFFVQINQGALNFSAPRTIGQTGNKIFFADMNGDGLSDLIQMGPDGTFFAQINQGDLNFSAPRIIGQTGNQILFADLNGDGISDLIQIGPDGTFFVQINQGAFNFSAPQTIGKTGNKILFGKLGF